MMPNLLLTSVNRTALVIIEKMESNQMSPTILNFIKIECNLSRNQSRNDVFPRNVGIAIEKISGKSTGLLPLRN